MSFNKLNIALQEVLEEEGVSSLNSLQEDILPKIKSGTDYMFIAPKGSGKSMTIVMSVVQRLLNTKTPFAPRALVIARDKKAVLELEQVFKDITLMMDLDVFAVFDSQKIYNQKDAIYLGVDIVIGTPRRMYEIYKEEGINLRQLKMFILDDAELMINNKHIDDVERIATGLKKCQRLLFANEYIPRFEEIKETFMDKAKIVELI